LSIFIAKPALLYGLPTFRWLIPIFTQKMEMSEIKGYQPLTFHFYSSIFVVVFGSELF